MSGWAASVRLITQDTVIGGKIMCKGHRVMVPHRLMHFDETFFWMSLNVFSPERWLENEIKENDLARSY